MPTRVMTSTHRRQIAALGVKLRAFPGKLRSGALDRAILAEAARLGQAIKAAAPVGETGTLRRAIKIVAGKTRSGAVSYRVVIGDRFFVGKAYYGAFVEFGTVKLRARHFIRGVFRARRRSIARNLETAVRRAVEREFPR